MSRSKEDTKSSHSFEGLYQNSFFPGAKVLKQVINKM